MQTDNASAPPPIDSETMAGFAVAEDARQAAPNTGASAAPEASTAPALSFDELKDHYLRVAQQALALWGYPPDSGLKLLNITENATYKVEHVGYDTIVMRVHRLIYAEQSSIETELAWLLALLQQTDLSLCKPLPARDSRYVQTITDQELGEHRHVVCFSYARGKTPRDSHDDTEAIGRIVTAARLLPKRVSIPLFGMAAVVYDWFGSHAGGHRNSQLSADDIGTYRQLGAIAATLHDQACGWQPPAGYQRIEWNWDATFGPGWNNFYGAHYEDLTELLTHADRRAIDTCVALMRRRVEAFGQSSDRYGMIHSDLRMANLLKEGETITVLDFDDCGRGWYLYDLAGIVGFMEHRPDLPEILDLIVEGYRTRRELTAADRQELMTFVMMRRIGLLQALIYHIQGTATSDNEATDLTPEILAFYARGTARLARHYLAAYRNLPVPTPLLKEESR